MLQAGKVTGPLIYLCLLMGWLLSPTVTATPLQVVDAAGQTVRLARPAQRIISLAPHLTEILFAIGAGDTLVGTVEYSDYPPQARLVRRVGSHARLDMESILALEPDLVIAWQSGTSTAQVERLQALGLTVYLSQARRINDVADDMQRLGRLTGREVKAEKAARVYRAKHRQLKRRYAQRSSVTVLYQVWGQPLVTVGGRHIINEAIEDCGGRNVFRGLDTLAPMVSREAVLQANPLAVVAGGMGNRRPEWLDDWRQWPQMQAVAQGRLYYLNADLLHRQGPRFVEGMAELCDRLERARQ